MLPHPAGLIAAPAGRIYYQGVLGPAGGDALQRGFPGTDAAGGICGFHVAGAHPGGGQHGLQGRYIPQQAAEETGYGGVPGAGGANHFHLEARRPQLLVSPGGQVGRRGAAHLAEALGPGGAQVQPTLAQLDHGHLYPQAE